MSERKEPTYLGDGVYATFDGYQMWLSVNHPENVQVALEPQVFQMLARYAASVWGPEVMP